MYTWFLVRKYLFSRFITFAALMVVAASVALLIVIVSVMEGFRSELQARIRGTSSDLKIESKRYIGLRDPERAAAIASKVPGVLAARPFVETLVLYRHESLVRSEDVEHRYLRVVDLDLGKDAGGSGRRPGDFSAYVGALKESDFPPMLRSMCDLSKLPHDLETLFSKAWTGGGLWALYPRRGPDPAERARRARPGVVLGIEAVKHAVLPGTLVRLTAFSPATEQPRTSEFVVAGYFKTGIYELDSLGILMDRDTARDFIGLTLPDGRETASGVRIDVAPELQAESSLEGMREAVAAALAAESVPFVRVQTWREEKGTLLQAVKTEKILMSMILGVIILFSGLMMFIILTLLVVEKTRDLGVLQSLGVTPSGVAGIFLRIGSALCFCGLALGASYGVLFALGVNVIQRWMELFTGWQVFPRDTYYLDKIPVRFQGLDLLLIIVPTVVVGFLGALIPAWRASRKDPVVALRYE